MPSECLCANEEIQQQRAQTARSPGFAKGADVIYFGTISETASTALGWMIAVDTVTWKVTPWCSMANGVGAGIWMSGAGPAVQSDGSIWVVMGNGDFD
jgi:hypothetical protein